jgi:hypothetical protein
MYLMLSAWTAEEGGGGGEETALVLHQRSGPVRAEQYQGWLLGSSSFIELLTMSSTSAKRTTSRLVTSSWTAATR